MEDFNKIIESLYIKFVNVKSMQIIKSARIHDYYDIQNSLILVNRGSVFHGSENDVVNDSEMLFIPSGKTTSIKFGSKPGSTVEQDELHLHYDEYFNQVEINPTMENIIILNFEAKVFESVNFFQSRMIESRRPSV